jgi:predicted alpha/beta-fold hydrolase
MSDENGISSEASTIDDVDGAIEKEARDSIYYDSNQEGDNKQNEEAEPDDDEEAYRLRVYGTEDFAAAEPTARKSFKRQSSSFSQFSKRLSTQYARRRSSAIESLPDTPAGWTVLLAALLTTGLGYEVQLQKSLTKPPSTFGQIPTGSTMASIYQKMTATANSILSRNIQPSLFVGTRGLISSTAAYLLHGPSSIEEHLRFREIVTSSQDGATVGVDWEVPWKTQDPETSTLTAEERTVEILKGPIRQPVVIILHGINNDASFGYMRSLQRTFANRGWNAAAMNFRGCGGVPMTTPRGYNAAYTGDIRNLVLQISGRLAENVPIFLVGNSLGASIMTKYLGEEGMSDTLPQCVAGAASLGNPLSINSDRISFPVNIFMALGIKKLFLQNWSAFSKMKDPTYKSAIRKGLLSPTIADLDRAVAPIVIRNEPFYPFATRVGYKNAESYWLDASSFRLIRHISVPFLNLTAEDDFLVAPSKNKFGFCISNPNVMVVETRCGGHLGWQESPPDSSSAFGASSWADAASADFFDSIMKVNIERNGSPLGVHEAPRFGTDDGASTDASDSQLGKMMKEDAILSSTKLQSRL